MSGFAGFVWADDEAQTQPQVGQIAARMAEQISFRGPDAAYSWTNNGACFCFSLLRTGPAPQAEAQPVTVDGRTWLLGDVRLDGRRDLIHWLRGREEECNACISDEELVLRAWRSQSPSEADELFRDVLMGDFSFVLWEPHQRELHCFRSLMGARPFFYLLTQEGIAFSNTIEAVRSVAGASLKLDSHFVGDFLLNSWCPDQERTVYRDIKRLAPGHAMTYSPKGVRARRVAQLPIEEPLWRKHAGEYLEEYRHLLREAVCDRLPHGPAVIFLSGGLDSGSIAAMGAAIQKECNGNGSLHALSMSGRPLFDDRETDFASVVAKHLEIPIGILEGGGCVPYAGWESQAFSLPELQHDPFYSLFVEQFQMVGQRARVALSGDGGDDVLSTPAVHYLKYLLRRGRAGTLVKAFGGYFLRNGKFPPLRTGIRGRIRTWLRSRKEAPEYPKWLDPEFERANRLRERWSELQIEPKSEHPIHPKGYGALTSPFWPRMAEDEDASWTGVPVESRAPFFDLRLMRFLLRLPPVPWCADKELVRLAMKGILPEEVRRRPKSPTAQEPLDLYVMEEKWLPPREASSQSVLKYVDWKKWKATPLNKTGSYLWTNLGPVSLDLWLNSVETKGQIE